MSDVKEVVGVLLGECGEARSCDGSSGRALVDGNLSYSSVDGRVGAGVGVAACGKAQSSYVLLFIAAVIRDVSYSRVDVGVGTEWGIPACGEARSASRKGGQVGRTLCGDVMDGEDARHKL